MTPFCKEHEMHYGTYTENPPTNAIKNFYGIFYLECPCCRDERLEKQNDIR